jgi:hypothetical protein
MELGPARAPMVVWRAMAAATDAEQAVTASSTPQQIAVE